MKPAWDGWAWVCKIVPGAWKKYLGKPGGVELAFNPEGAEEDVPPTALQIASAERAAREPALERAVSAAIRKRHAKEIGKRRLEDLVELQEMFVQPLELDGIAFVGFGFSAEWDPEHGLGVVTHGTRVLEIGGAADAFLMWIARRHGARDLVVAKEPGARKPKPVAPKKKPAAPKPKPVAPKKKPAAPKPKPAAPKPRPAARKPKPVAPKKKPAAPKPKPAARKKTGRKPK